MLRVGVAGHADSWGGGWCGLAWWVEMVGGAEGGDGGGCCRWRWWGGLRAGLLRESVLGASGGVADTGAPRS